MRRIFSTAAGDECLTAKARVHAHDKDQIQLVEHIFDCAFRRGRVQRNASLLAKATDHLKRPVEMRSRFCMDGNNVRACLGKSLE